MRSCANGLRIPNLRPQATLLLAFDRLPVTHFPTTDRVLAVTLIGGGRNEPATAMLSQTNSGWQTGFPGRTQIFCAMFTTFHREFWSRWIRPNGWLEPFGHFFLRCATLDDLARRQPTSQSRPCRQFPPQPTQEQRGSETLGAVPPPVYGKETQGSRRREVDAEEN